MLRFVIVTVIRPVIGAVNAEHPVIRRPGLRVRAQAHLKAGPHDSAQGGAAQKPAAHARGNTRATPPSPAQPRRQRRWRGLGGGGEVRQDGGRGGR